MTSNNKLILSAGMPRSGSTWLYNAARLLLIEKMGGQEQLSCGWIDDISTLPTREIMLIKIHDFDKTWVEKASLILYSFRDVRDALASAKRKFGLDVKLEHAGEYISHGEQWRNVADFIMRYEDMITNQAAVLTELGGVLGITHNAAINNAVNQLEGLSFSGGKKEQSGIIGSTAAMLGFGKKKKSYNAENLLHEGHITDGRVGSWHAHLDPGLVREIEQKYSDWFKANGYDIL